jgi:multidrug efflux pump subunit AcrB
LTSKPAPYRFSSFSIVIVFVCLCIAGLSLIPLLNIQLNPSRAAARFSVSFQWPEASARVVEQEVTSRLEGLFSSVKGITNISSVSRKGSGSVNLQFKDEVDLNMVRFEVAGLIRQVYQELPEQVSYPQISMSTSGNNAQAVLSYTLNASLSPHYIQQYGEKAILPVLAKVPGVDKVNIYGASPFEWAIEFDVDKARQLGISGDDITSSIQGYFRKGSLGKGMSYQPGYTYLNESSLMFSVQPSDSVDWNNIPVKKAGQRIISLGDIAGIKYKEQEPSSYYRINGLNTINIVIYPEEDVNTIQVGRDIKAAVTSITEDLPAGYNLLLSYDATEYLSKELGKISLRTLFSLVILLAFVLVVSRKFRYLLIILLSIIANLLIACIFYYFIGVELQLYSLAGLTISFGIIIDNSIVMIDHLRHNKDRKVFLAILAATLTTIGALSVIFFLEEQQRLNLVDFAWVIIINLLVSMAVALFFIPALMDKIKLSFRKKKLFYRRKRRLARFTNVYERIIHFSKRWRWAFFMVFILSFGLPLHWLPDELEGEDWWAKTYNATLSSSWFKEEARPVLEKALGGTLRLFTVDVFENSSYPNPERTTLYVRGKMPDGCTIGQLNEAVRKMENYISRYEEVEMFRTTITSYANSSIAINFKPEHEWSGFPYFLKSELESRAISLGGMDWSVYGVGQGFSNALHSGYKNSRIHMEGYNYEQLYRYAQLLRKDLLENPRIKEVEIKGNDSWQSEILQEFSLDFDMERLALHDVSQADFYRFLKDKAYRSNLPPVYQDMEAQNVYLSSDSYGDFSKWEFNHEPALIGDKMLKLEQFGTIKKTKTGNDIHKENQQYKLVVAYDFIGPHQLSTRVRERHVKEMNEFMPVGYQVRDSSFGGWNRKDKKQYYLIGLIILIIYFICAILLESLLQPLAIIAMIPISFIGLFLTFYLFELNFDQGGFAAFILLCGLSVNANLFIINDFNNYRKRKGKEFKMRAYLKAYNHKIMPVILTIVSTVIGLLPFIWGGQQEVFWFAFAAGSIGGLLFSIVAIPVYLPLFLKLK